MTEKTSFLLVRLQRKKKSLYLLNKLAIKRPLFIWILNFKSCRAMSSYELCIIYQFYLKDMELGMTVQSTSVSIIPLLSMYVLRKS